MSEDNVVQLFKAKTLVYGNVTDTDIIAFLEQLDHSLEIFHTLSAYDKYELYNTLVGFTKTSMNSLFAKKQ